MSKYTQIKTTDIPFEVFTLFSRTEQKTHAHALLTVASMAADDLEGAVSYDSLAEAMHDSAGEGDEDHSFASREIGTLKKYQLIRRQSRYDQTEKAWVDYVYLTGRGRKVADFLVSISQMDIQETKEANIQSALFSMRAAASDETSGDVLLYDALKAAHEGIADLVNHLGAYSGTFRDFIEANTKKIENARQAKEWIDTMFRSNLLSEYFTIVETTYSYSAKLGEIRMLAQRLQHDEKLTGRIVEQEFKRRKEIAEKTNTKADKGALERDVSLRVRRLYEMTDYEYHRYIGSIQEMVTEIIQRTYFVLTSFGAGNDNNSIVMKLLKLVRYAQMSGAEIPLSISNLYEQGMIDPESLRSRPSRNAREDIAPVEVADVNCFDERDDSLLDRRQEAIEMARGLIHDGDGVSTEVFPCSDIDDYLRLFILTGYADRENNPSAEFHFTKAEGTIETNGFVLPKGRYEKVRGSSGEAKQKRREN